MRYLNLQLCGRVALCGVILTSVARLAYAQESAGEPIGTDRPTFGPAADLVPAGSLQMEHGTAATFQKNQYVVDLPESLIRLGISSQAEIRFRSASTVYQPSGAGNRFQASDVELSTKFLVDQENSVAPKAGILAVSFPTGGPDLTSGSYDPSLTFIWNQVSPSGYFLNEVVQGALTTQDGARRGSYAPSIAGGRAFHEKLAAYVEYAPTILTDHTVVHATGAGLLFIRNRVHQFDLHGGSIRDASGVHPLIGVGYSVRLDHFLGLGRGAEAGEVR